MHQAFRRTQDITVVGGKEMGRLEDLTGTRKHELICICGDTPSTAYVKCLVCETKFICNKSAFKAGKVSCRNKTCKTKEKLETNKISTVGTEINGFKCIAETEHGILKIECLKCGDSMACTKLFFSSGLIKCQSKKCAKHSKIKLIK